MSTGKTLTEGFCSPNSSFLHGGRKHRSTLAILLMFSFALVGQTAGKADNASPPSVAKEGVTPSAPIDLVLLMDDSASVFRWSKEVDDYLLGPFIRDYLRLGDTVHLLSFASTVDVDAVRTISGEDDIKAILGQLFLLYPIKPHTDFIAALDFLAKYVRGLDSTRKKLIVIVTDGVQDPPPESPWATLDAAAVSKEIDRSAKLVRSLGWPVRFVLLPFGSDSNAIAGVQANATGTLPSASASASVPAPAPASASAPAAVSPGAETSPSRQSTSSGGEAASAMNADVTTWPPPSAVEAARPESQSTAPPAGVTTSSLASSGGFDIPTLSFPSDLGDRRREFTLPLTIHNKGPTALSFDLVSISSNGRELLVNPVKETIGNNAEAIMRPRLRIPDDIAAGRLDLPIVLTFAGGVRTVPGGGVLGLVLLEGSPLFRFASSPAALAALGICVFFIVALIVLRVLGWLPIKARGGFRGAMERVATAEPGVLEHRAEAEKMSAAALPSKSGANPRAPRQMRPERVDYSSAPSEKPGIVGGGLNSRALGSPATGPQPDRFPSFASTVRQKGHIRVEFRVLEQNSHIGRRNVHELHEGQARSVGGKRSDYLIFLVPMPQSVAELHFDGESCVFVPSDRRLFPELSGPVQDCLDRDIPMLSPRGYALTLRFSRWEEPSLRINRLLHCIEVPGLDWDRHPAVEESHETGPVSGMDQ